MLQSSFSETISGADKFQLLLDRHIRLKNSTGNISRLSIKVAGTIDLEKLKAAVESNSFLSEINSLLIEDDLLIIPRWKKGEKLNHVDVEELKSFDAVFRKDIKVNSEKLLHIGVVYEQETTIVIISAHHVIADFRGIQDIAKIISGTIQGTIADTFIKEENPYSFIEQLKQTLKATTFVFKKSPNKLAKLKFSKGDGENGISILRFTENETKEIEENAVTNGARLSRSAFYLAAVATALKQSIFSKKGEIFFLPVPQNQRPRGNEQVALGNQLSFLFYTIPFSELKNLREATAFITSQMLEQIKMQMPKSYSQLLESFRFLPLPVYDFFFKLPTLGAVCSFLFSDVGETLPDMKTFLGYEVLETLNFAPNPTPPGFTIVFMKDRGALKITMTYDRNAVTGAEITKFETLLKTSLRGNLSADRQINDKAIS